MAHTALRPDGYPRKSYKAMKPYREGQGGNDRLDMAHACCGKGRSSEEGRRPQFRLRAAEAIPRQFLALIRPNARHSPQFPPPLYMSDQIEPNSPAL